MTISVRGPAAAVAETVTVISTSDPANACGFDTVTSDDCDPAIAYVNAGSSPLPARQTEYAVEPEEGRASVIVDSVTLHVFEPVSTSPNSSTVIGPLVPPSVVGSTAVTSSIPPTGWLAESETRLAAPSAAATTRGIVFESVPSGFRAWIVTAPAPATSAGAIVTVHAVALAHVVAREAPPTSSVVPGPGLVGTKSYPLTASVKPFAAPAVTLAGEMPRIAAAEVSATVADADCVASSWLVAVTVTTFGLGADAGAVYTPLDVIVPHALPPPAAAHATCQVTPVFSVAETVAANSTVPPGATTEFPGESTTLGCAKTPISPVALRAVSAAAVAVTYTPAGLGAAAGAR